MTWEIRQGDALERLREMPGESVQCVVTSPPYWGLRDYGTAGQLGLERTPEEYVAKMVEVFREIRRVLRKDGTLWLNLGDAYCSQGGNGRAGFNGQVREDQANKDARIRPTSGLKPKDLVGIPWRVAFALQADGWWLRSDIIWSKPNPMPESVTDRPTKAHEYVFLMTKSERYYFDGEAVREDQIKGAAGSRFDLGKTGERDGGERTQKGYRDKIQSKRPDGWASHAGDHGSIHKDGREQGAPAEIRAGRNIRSVWTIATQPFPEAHFATFPEKLVEPCVKAGSRVGDTVLDPFAGSGTVGVLALRHSRSFLGIELKVEYAEMARRRIRGDAELLNGHSEVPVPGSLGSL